MAHTKIDLITSAYSQMRISGLTVNPSPEDITVALNRMEDMAAEFDARNICTGYSISTDPDPSDLTNLEQKFWHFYATNLASRLFSDFGMQPPQTLMIQASQSLSTASSVIAADNIRQVSAPNRMPLGSGTSQRYNGWQRFNRNVPIAPDECATHNMIIGDIDDFAEDFTAYLKDGEVIDTYTITADSGLLLISDSSDGTVISYRIEAISNSGSGIWQQVKIVSTTDNGRVTTRRINFNVTTNETVGNDT